MDTSKTSAPRIYVSYSHRDRQWVDRLVTYLRAFALDDIWVDTKVDLGANWGAQTVRALEEAKIAIVLVTPAYLASEYIKDKELPGILKAATEGRLRIIPVMVEHTFVERTDLWNYQFANPPSEPLSALSRSKQDRVLRNVASTIYDALEHPITRSAAPPAASLAAEIASKVVEILRDKSSTDKKDDSKLVFVIMAYTSDMDPVFEGIAEAARSTGLEAKRVKDVPGDYRISSQIMSMISGARIVVADLTHERPNVYFELGYARGLGRPVVTCAREGTQIHFDVADWAYIPYSDSRVIERQLIERFKYELEKGA
jgi:hypothetical protein